MVTGVVKEAWGRLSGVVEKALQSRSTHALDLHLYFPEIRKEFEWQQKGLRGWRRGHFPITREKAI